MYGNSHATLCVTRFDVGGKQKNQKKKTRKKTNVYVGRIKNVSC